MRSSRLASFGTTGAILVLAAGLLSCGDRPLPMEGVSRQPQGVIVGRVVEDLGDQGLDSLRLALLQLDELRFAAQTTTASDGSFRFTQLYAGRYMPLSLSNDAVLFDLAPEGYALGERDSLLLTLRAHRQAAATVDVSGVVVDAATQAPLANALVEMGTLLLAPEIQGYSPPNRDLSDTEGRFTLRDVPLFRSSDGTTTLAPDLEVQLPGYRGLRVAVNPQLVPLHGLHLELHAGQDAGRVSGVLLDLGGTPAAGVPVGLEWLSTVELPSKSDDAPPPSRLVLQGVHAVSDQSGGFELDALPDGQYSLLPGYLPGDGWLRVDSGNLPAPFTRPRFQIQGGATVVLDSIPVAQASRPIWPPEGELVSSRPDFAWSAWPFVGTTWAESYTLVLARFGSPNPAYWLYLYPIDGTSFAWPDSVAQLPAGRHLWRIEAYGGRAAKSALFEHWASLRVGVAALAASSPGTQGLGSICNRPLVRRVCPLDGR